jgi:hypothetical protein
MGGSLLNEKLKEEFKDDNEVIELIREKCSVKGLEALELF